jgi:hypothetical protein
MYGQEVGQLRKEIEVGGQINSYNIYPFSSCGLALPPDNVLIQSAKQCAISSGFNTASAQQVIIITTHSLESTNIINHRLYSYAIVPLKLESKD